MVAKGNLLTRSPAARLLGWLRGAPPYGVVAMLCGHRVVVKGASMYPLLTPGDRVLFDRSAYRAESPIRGDVVLVEPAQRPGERMIKLIVGLPGERLEVRRDRLWIDGRRLAFPQPVVGSLPGTWQLGAGEYFVLSHAVAVGTDSRHFGPVPSGALRGRARRVYWPPARRRPLSAVPLEFETVGDGDATR